MTSFSVLIRDFDDIDWRPRTDDFFRRDLARHGPLWLRIANFYERNISFLELLPPGQLVLWKMEHWGGSTPFDHVPATAGLNLDGYVQKVLSLGHRISPYTFTERNVELLRTDIPCLRDLDIAVLPIAQKPLDFESTVLELRTELGIGAEELLLGAGGLGEPSRGKGLDELACWFLSTVRDPATHLLCTVIPDGDGFTAESLRARWEFQAGVLSSPRLHIRISDYGSWPWMCSFYSEINAMLINSVSDSWGRMAAEAIGFGVPTLIRRANCATNDIVADPVLVDAYAGMSEDRFRSLLARATDRSAAQARFVNRNYNIPRVRGLLLALLARKTPAELLPELDRLARKPLSVSLADTLIVK